MNHSKNKSFTLIEVLIVIIIIGILASLILFSTQDAYEKVDRLEVLSFEESLKAKNLKSLVAEWKFDGATSAGSIATNSDVRDSWGYNHGDITGHAPTIRDGEDCVSGKCLEFDGLDDYVSVLHNPTMILSESYTLSFWAYNGVGSKSYPTFFNKHTQSSSAGFWWTYSCNTNEEGIRWQYSRTSGEGYTSTTWSPVFKPNDWSYVVIIFDQTLNTTTLYVNSLNKGSPSTVARAILSGTLYIGTYNGSMNGSYNFQGKMDDIRIYNTNLSISEIKKNYVAGLNSMLKNGAISKEEYNQRTSNLAKND